MTAFLRTQSIRASCAKALRLLFCVLAFPCLTFAARAQQPEAKALITATCATELASDRSDHTAFQYRDHDVTPDHNTLVYTVESPQGDLSRTLKINNEPLTPAQDAADTARLKDIVAHPEAIEKKRSDQAHDDTQAEQMLELFPNAFLWSVAKEDGSLVELNFKPDPAYNPPTMEARVFASMAGQVVVDRKENRIYSIRGTLITDVKFGFGLFGRLKKGGTFNVERREVAPGHWQMTVEDVHLVGKALFFKTIGSVEEEQRDSFKISPAKTLQQAYELLPKD